jgi:predicted phosphodiesterase
MHIRAATTRPRALALRPPGLPFTKQAAVPDPITRILSDLHYGEQASLVGSPRSLAPLLAGVSQLLLNGDTLDTRPGPFPAITQHLRGTLADFVRETPTVFITGNHDPDISPVHLHELAGGRVLVTHGDIAFDNIVPWSRDAPLARQLVLRERARVGHAGLEHLLTAHRRAAFAIPTRDRAEGRGWTYWGGFLRDVLWPPLRAARILRAWAEMPVRIAAWALAHRPQARFIIVGHTHRPGIWRRPDGRVVINTGSFCRPLGRLLVDVTPDHVRVRQIATHGREFHPGDLLAEFALAESGFPAQTSP